MEHPLKEGVVPCRGPMLGEDSVVTYTDLPIVGAVIRILEDGISVRCPCIEHDDKNGYVCNLRTGKDFPYKCAYMSYRG
jgi:hypothetical protein